MKKVNYKLMRGGGIALFSNSSQKRKEGSI